VASAAAAAVANGLSRQRTRHALALAVTANLSLQATRLGELSMWKGCAAGNACRNGVFAAELAAAGLTGPPAPFTGRGGLFQVTGGEPDMRWLGPAHRPAIAGCHVKRFPSGYFSQGAIQAALDLHARLNGRPPAAVEVGTFEFGKKVMAGDTQKWHPATRETADHSIPYVVACALARGRVNRGDLDESQLTAPDIVRLLDVLTVEVDQECAAAWPEACMNRVTVAFADGGEESATVRYYRGHAKNPMSDRELEDKFRDQAASVLTDADADALLAAIWELDEADSPDALFTWTAIGG
jgi:2-methylcitrate dehydratase